VKVVRDSDPDPKGHVWANVTVRDGKLVFVELHCVRCGWRAPDVRPRPACGDEVARQVMES